MRKMLLVVLMILLLLPVFGEKIGGVILPDQLSFADNDLQLNGAGLRKKVIIKVYACGLYLPGSSTSSEEILTDTTAIAVRMHFIYNEVDQSKLIESWNAGFAKTGADRQFASEVARFNSLFSEPAQKGDIYDIVYTPENGVEVFKNSQLKGNISNSLFRSSVFSIWLSPKTDLPKLREKLLGD